MEDSPRLDAEQTRKDLARGVTALFEKWHLEDDEQLTFLGLDRNSRHELPEYRSGERALPNNADMLDRVTYLLGIHGGLRLLFPEDQATRFGWVKMRNRALDGRTALDVMLRQGLVGVALVARLVDAQRGR